jgi:hypothetical protein
MTSGIAALPARRRAQGGMSDQRQCRRIRKQVAAKFPGGRRHQELEALLQIARYSSKWISYAPHNPSLLQNAAFSGTRRRSFVQS